METRVIEKGNNCHYPNYPKDFRQWYEWVITLLKDDGVSGELLYDADPLAELCYKAGFAEAVRQVTKEDSTCQK